MPATFDSADDSRCPADELLLAYIPGRLAGAEASSVEEHLKTCKICQSRITTLRERPGAKRAGQGEVKVVDSVDSPLGRMAFDSSRAGSLAATLVKETRPPTPRHLGEYELIRCIGRGGMGVVYRAVHTKLKRKVAIKLLPHLNFSDPTAIARLQREMAAAGRVKHPNIVYALDAGERDGIEYLVLEYVEGLDLGKLVAILGPLSVADACEVIRQAAVGLVHIDQCGLVHRDLKPSNLMLADDGTVKVLDLGLALMLTPDGDATKSGYLLGTADYVSPEQIDDPHHADVRSDLYSLGCTFYKLLAGHAPFGKEHESVTSKLYAQRHMPPPPIQELRADVPDAVVALLACMLEKDPACRPQRPQAVVDALTPLVAGADLPALVRRAHEHGDLEGVPIPNPSQTPPSADASTHAYGRTPTPQPKVVAGRSQVWKLTAAALGAMVVACGALLAVPGIRSLLAPKVLPGTHEPGTRGAVESAAPISPADAAVSIQPLPAPTPTDALLAAAKALSLPQGDRPRTLKVDPKFQMIEASADDFQLIQLGTLERGEGTVRMDVEFRRDRGEAGFFFGYHAENVVPDRLWGVAHFVHLSMLPSKTDQRLFDFIREQSQIRPGNSVLVSTVERSLKLPATSADRFKLEIQYAPAGIQAIRLDGKEVPELLATAYSKQFDPQTIWGVWGIYNNDSSIRVFRPTMTKGP